MTQDIKSYSLSDPLKSACDLTLCSLQSTQLRWITLLERAQIASCLSVYLQQN